MSKRRFTAVLLAGLLVATPLLAGGKGTRSRGGGDKGSGGSKSVATRTGGGGSQSAPSGRGAGRASRPSSGSPTVASGTSTWRHLRNTGRFYRYAGHYGYYGPYGYYGVYGYPYYHGWYYRHYDPWVYWWCGVPWLYGPWGAPVAYAEIEVEPHHSAVLLTQVRPKRATVRLNGEAIGQARDYSGLWDELEVPAGRHVVEFEKDGYRTLRLFLQLDAGDVQPLRYRLVRGDGLDARSDEIPQPEPAKEPPKPAARAETARPAEREEFRADVRPTERRPAALSVGYLRIEAAPADAAVYLDGEFYATASELSRLHGAIPVAPGRHRVEVVRPGYLTQTVAVDLEAGAAETVRVRLVAKD